MSITKHKIFKLRLSQGNKFVVTQKAEAAINEFLLDPNNVYINHSVTTLTEDIDEYGNSKTICRYVLISLIYKDLNATPFDTATTSKKVQSVIHKQIESGEEIPMPDVETAIDREIKEMEKTPQARKSQELTFKEILKRKKLGEDTKSTISDDIED